MQGKVNHTDAYGKLYQAAVAVGSDDHEAEATINSGLDVWSTP
jgi:hypothetical protein